MCGISHVIALFPCDLKHFENLAFGVHKSDRRAQILRSDASLDTKNGQIILCHIFMSYGSFDIKCHTMLNDAYDIRI